MQNRDARKSQTRLKICRFCKAFLRFEPLQNRWSWVQVLVPLPKIRQWKGCLIFYPLRKQWHIITCKRVYHCRRRISSAEWRYKCFRNDDIQRFYRRWYAISCEIDDMHAFGVISDFSGITNIITTHVCLELWLQFHPFQNCPNRSVCYIIKRASMFQPNGEYL